MLLRKPVRPCELFELLPEPFGPWELKLRGGLIMEVCADGGQIRVNPNAKLSQIGGGADAAAEQDLRRAVHTGTENDQVRAQLTGLPSHPGTDAEGTPVRDEHTFHGRPGHDPELPAVPPPIQIPQPPVPPDAIRDVHRLWPKANLTVEVIDVVGEWDAGGGRSSKKPPLKRLDLLR